MIPTTTILEVHPAGEYHMPAYIIVRFKGKRYRVQKGGPVGPGLNVFGLRKTKYVILKTQVGEGIFKDMLKEVEGVHLPPGFKQ